MESYTVHDINKLLAAQNDHALARLENAGAKDRTDQFLFDPENRYNLHKSRSIQAQATSYARDTLLKSEKDEVEALRAQLVERRSELLRRRARLQSARRLLREQILQSHLAKKENETASGDAEDEAAAVTHGKPSDRQSCYHLRHVMIPSLAAQKAALTDEIHERRKNLLTCLEEIYPIEVVEPASLLFSIVGVPLPNLSEPSASAGSRDQSKEIQQLEGDDDTISSALGYVAQLVLLLSNYLATPLHYSIATAGSRAVIHDAISAINGPRVFPLYAKGMEHYRFEYAVFLLQKDIEQLLSIHQVSVLDINHILPNLKNLIVSILSSSGPPKHRARRRADATDLGGSVAASEITLRGYSSSGPPSRASSSSMARARQDLRGKLGLGDGPPVSLRHFVPNTAQGAAETIEESLHRRKEDQRLRRLEGARSLETEKDEAAPPRTAHEKTPSGVSFAWLTWRGTQVAEETKREQREGQQNGDSKHAHMANGQTSKEDIGKERNPPVIRSLGASK